MLKESQRLRDAMAVIKFCENFLLRLRHQQRVVSERILSGTEKEHYDQLTGKLIGLKIAESQLKELYSNTFDSERLEALAERSENEQNVEKTKLY